MNDQAWPFLIGRTRTEDHRMVVIPDFMAAGGLAGALRAAVGRGSPGQPGSVQVQEIQDQDGGHVTVIYRVGPARADHWGLLGEHDLTDEHGRPIMLTEGLVVRRPAADVGRDGIAEEDFGHAHSLVVSPYLDFWAQGPAFARTAAPPFLLTRSGSLVPVSPPAPAAVSVPAPRPSAAASAASSVSEHARMLTSGLTAELAVPAEPDRHDGRRPGKAVLIAVSLAVAAAVIACWLTAALPGKSTSPTPPRGPATSSSPLVSASPTASGGATAPSPAGTIQAVCRALESRDLSRLYAAMTSAYRETAAKGGLAAGLLPADKTVPVQCGFSINANADHLLADATMMVAAGHSRYSWHVTLIKASGGTWQVSGISPAGTSSPAKAA